MTESGKFYTTSIYHIKCDKSMLQIGSDELPASIFREIAKDYGLVVWEHQGIFKLMDPTLIRNLEIRYETDRSINALYPRITPPKGLDWISWSQGVSISPAVVKILLSTPNDSSDNLGDTNPTTGPNSEDQPDKP